MAPRAGGAFLSSPHAAFPFVLAQPYLAVAGIKEAGA